MAIASYFFVEQYAICHCWQKPFRKLTRAVHELSHVCLIADPSEEELDGLVIKSQIVIMPVFSRTGIRPEIYYALTKGKHCIYYGPETGCQFILQCCHIARHEIEIDEKIKRLFVQPFEESDIRLRNELINSSKIQSRVDDFMEVMDA